MLDGLDRGYLMIVRVAVVLLLVGLVASLCVQWATKPHVLSQQRLSQPTTPEEVLQCQERYIRQLKSVYSDQPLEKWPESARSRYLHALRVRDDMLSHQNDAAQEP